MRPTGIIGGATRGAGCLDTLERPLSGDIGTPFGRLRLAASETCDVFALSYGDCGVLLLLLLLLLM